jgi:predicted nucleotidyltransferase component of viral defense system
MRYSPPTFAPAVKSRIQKKVKETGRNFSELSREFLLQRFLARVFASPASLWVLKGGTGLLMRLPGSRHSQDLDLMHATADLDSALLELQQIADTPGIDHYTFILGNPQPMTGGVDGTTIKVTVYLGAQEVGAFPIDLSTHLDLVAGIDAVTVIPIIEIDDVAPLPKFRIYPLPDQIADKVCAMYSTYGQAGNPSTRYRDLADLVSIINRTTFLAAPTALALKSESSRRGIKLPVQMRRPADTWATGYQLAAKRFGTLEPRFHDVETALTHVGQCLNPLLTDNAFDGDEWDFVSQTWTRLATDTTLS